MSESSSICELNLSEDIIDNNCINIIIIPITESQFSSDSYCVTTHSTQENDVIPEKSESNHVNEETEEVFIEDVIELDILTENSNSKNEVQNHYKRKHSIEELVIKDSNESTDSVPKVLTHDTKVNQRKRYKFSPQKRLRKLKAQGIKDHYYVIDEEEPETKLKCTVCTSALTRGKWSIASKSCHTIKKHLDSNMHQKSVKRFINHFNQTNQMDINTDNAVNDNDGSHKVLDLDAIHLNSEDLNTDGYNSELIKLYNVWNA